MSARGELSFVPWIYITLTSSKHNDGISSPSKWCSIIKGLVLSSKFEGKILSAGLFYALIHIKSRAVKGVSISLLQTTAWSSYVLIFEWTEGVFQNIFRPYLDRCKRHSCPIYHAKGTHNADLKVSTYTDINILILVLQRLVCSAFLSENFCSTTMKVPNAERDWRCDGAMSSHMHACHSLSDGGASRERGGICWADMWSKLCNNFYPRQYFALGMEQGCGHNVLAVNSDGRAGEVRFRFRLRMIPAGVALGGTRGVKRLHFQWGFQICIQICRRCCS